MIATTARSVRITGQVQGVGFRPFVHRLATRHQLNGWVRNASGAVQIEVEGQDAEIGEFLDELVTEAPPLATIETIQVQTEPAHGYRLFEILGSVTEPDRWQAPPPDAAICPTCEAELFDPSDRRYRYPFITCTDCGPRYTVIQAMPYDRERTSMVAFTQCPACLAEYHNPTDRRFHSESNGCAHCGPRLWYADQRGVTAARSADPLALAANLIRDGQIVAIRGLGGFQLAVDATNDAAVRRLRERKGREAKPLAVMVRTIEAAQAIATVSPAEAKLLTSRARPIVLVTAIAGALAPSVAPHLDSVGVMLGATPLHHLLLDLVGRPLVMTSGNRSDEPIAIGNAEAIDRLGDVADGFLLHDREVLARYDDSVARVVDDRPLLLRRARGYAPTPIGLPIPTPRHLLAVGPHLKNTFALAAGPRAFVSQHIGDLDSLEGLNHFETTLGDYRRLFRIDPEVVVRDLHPGYLSTRIAAGWRRPTIAVQHHHAHVAAVAAEHGITERILGVAFDGTGHGTDGLTWGAEFMAADLTEFTRLGHLDYVPLPGGDLAARNPWRAALGYAVKAGLTQAWQSVFASIDRTEFEVAVQQTVKGLNAPSVSSMGRLFDAAAAVIGVRLTSSHEAQAAMELEALAGRRPATEITTMITERDGRWLIDPTRILANLFRRRERGADPGDLAADFHASVAFMTEQMVRRMADRTGLGIVALSGGVFQNARLLWSVRRRLEAAGLRVLIPRQLGVNDGAISYGQAAVAAARLTRYGDAAAN